MEGERLAERQSQEPRILLVRDLDPVIEIEMPLADRIADQAARGLERMLARGAEVRKVAPLVVDRGFVVEDMEEEAGHPA